MPIHIIRITHPSFGGLRDTSRHKPKTLGSLFRSTTRGPTIEGRPGGRCGQRIATPAAQATQANALRQALELATVRYEAGLSSYLDLLDAQRSLFGAELAASQAQLGELKAAVQLYKALGGSWVGTPVRRR